MALTIAPDPGPSPAQKEVIERPHGMRVGTVDLKVRKALACDTKQRLELDLDPKARRREDRYVVRTTGSDKQVRPSARRVVRNSAHRWHTHG